MARNTSIAWHNLVHDRPRTAIALAGIGFSLIVIFMQLGFLRATHRTATLVLDQLDFDILIVSKNYHYLADAGSFPMTRIRQAEAVPGVRSVTPFYVRSGLWRSLSGAGQGELARTATNSRPNSPAPKRPPSWKIRNILVLAYFPTDAPFKHGVPGVRAGGGSRSVPTSLDAPDTLLVDRRSRWEFGPQEEGTAVELNKGRYQIAGTFEMGTGFAADGAALLGHHNFARAFGAGAVDAPTLGLVKVADRRRVGEVVRRLEEALASRGLEAAGENAVGERPGANVRVFDRDTIESRERWYWISEKAIGILFVMGVVIAFLVGVVVVYQVFSSDIADHLPEYATLKAIGYSDRRVASVVVEQAVILGLVGYAGALIVSVGLYAFVEYETRLPMSLRDPMVLSLPMFLGVVMSSASALLSLRKLQAADPADLFR